MALGCCKKEMKLGIKGWRKKWALVIDLSLLPSLTRKEKGKKKEKLVSCWCSRTL